MASSRQRGALMVLSLWLIVILIVIAYSLAYEMRIGMKMTSQGKKRIQAQALAQAGLAKAVMDLRNDRLVAMADRTQSNDTLADIWTMNDDKTAIKYGGGTYTVRVIDEERKINVNNLQNSSLLALRYLIEEKAGIDKKESESIANALLDYKDQDITASGVSGGMDEIECWTDWGLKNYGRELPDGWSFRPKNDNILTIEELLEIPGITREVLYGDPKHVPMDPIERVDWLEEPREESSALADYLTVNSTAQVNINTCSRGVIEAALYAAAGGMAGDVKSMASQIEKLREERLKIKDAEGLGITNLTQLQKAKIPQNMFDQLASGSIIPFGFASGTFTIISRGEFEGVRFTVQAMVQVTLEPYNLNPDDKRHESGRDRTGYGSLKSQPYLIIDPAVRVIRMWEL